MLKLSQLDRADILILGFGVEGQATYEFLRERYPKKQLAIADKRLLPDIQIPEELSSRLNKDEGVQTYCGENYLSHLSEYQVIVKSPGIADSIPGLANVEKNGTIVTSHLEIFFELFDRNRVIGITGTKGKSTTTSLIFEILSEAGLEVILGGNIGEPVLTKLGRTSSETLFVLEL